MDTTTKVTVEVDENTSEMETVFHLEAPLFILFAEYLGYVSLFNTMSEDWCNGKVPDIDIQKAMIVEAKCILRQMKKDYSLEDIRNYYTMYYPLILKEYVDKLESLIDDEE